MTSPAPGWYPDPGGTAPYRWWNGQAWTTATSDGTTAAVAQPTVGTPATATTTTAGYGTASASYGAAGAGESGATPYGTPSPFGATSNYSQVMSTHRAQNDSLWHQNQLAMFTFIAAALSIMFALSTGFVPLIVTPFFTAFGSKSKGEKLAPLAFGAAIICGVVGFVTLRNRF